MSERGSYRSIPNALLSGPDFRRLSERARWIFVVLKMNVGAAGIDVWYPDELVIRLAAESGATPDQVRLTLDILEHENWIRREDNIIWVVGHITHDPHLSANDEKHRKNVARHVAGLPRTSIVRAFITQHSEWFRPEEAPSMGLGWAFEGPKKGRKAGTEGASKGVRSKRQERNENEEEYSASGDAGAHSGPKLHSGAKYPAYPTAVSHRLAVQWRQSRGPVDEGVFRRMTAKLYASGSCEYTVEQLEASIVAFGEAAEVAPADKSQFWSVTKWVDDVHRWVRLGAMPLVDPDSGTVTERGRLAAGLAA